MFTYTVATAYPFNTVPVVLVCRTPTDCVLCQWKRHQSTMLCVFFVPFVHVLYDFHGCSVFQCSSTTAYRRIPMKRDHLHNHMTGFCTWKACGHYPRVIRNSHYITRAHRVGEMYCNWTGTQYRMLSQYVPCTRLCRLNYVVRPHQTQKHTPNNNSNKMIIKSEEKQVRAREHTQSAQKRPASRH